MRSIVRALIAAGIPLVFGPGAIHLPTVPDHRKWNRIDLGTADKVASAALGIVDQAERLGIAYDGDPRSSLLELGGGFSAALAVDGGRIVDGLGGSAGPIGARACGALDAEAAYLIGGALSKRTVFSGGALDPDGSRRPRRARRARAAARGSARARGLARARGGRGEGRARADRVGAGAARGPRRRPPGRGPRAPRRARRAAGARGARSAPRSRSRARRAARRSWPTAWRAARYAPLVERPAPARGARRRARPPADVRRGADRAGLTERRCGVPLGRLTSARRSRTARRVGREVRFGRW